MAAAPCGYPRRPTRVHRLQHGSGVTASGPVDEEARFATKKPIRTVGEVIVKSGLSVAIVALLGVIAGCNNLATRPEKPPEHARGPSCDMSLWAHVYHGRFPSAEDRLQVINPCLTVSGIIVKARSEKDGDWHIQLDLDPEYRSLLNKANLEEQHGYLVLEPICSHRITKSATMVEGVCDGFSQRIFTKDLIGKRVTAMGAYVMDRQHG